MAVCVPAAHRGHAPVIWCQQTSCHSAIKGMTGQPLTQSQCIRGLWRICRCVLCHRSTNSCWVSVARANDKCLYITILDATWAEWEICLARTALHKPKIHLKTTRPQTEKIFHIKCVCRLVVVAKIVAATACVCGMCARQTRVKYIYFM